MPAGNPPDAKDAVRLKVRQFQRLFHESSSLPKPLPFTPFLTKYVVAQAEVLKPNWQEDNWPAEEKYPNQWVATRNSMSTTVRQWESKVATLNTGEGLVADDDGSNGDKERGGEEEHEDEYKDEHEVPVERPQALLVKKQWTRQSFSVPTDRREPSPSIQ
ncbi:hypothetical protein ACHAQK_012231 [Fusarium lateritium]